MATDPGDLVLDPTCGSGTTAFVAEQWGRRWITIDTSRVALALARARIMGARYPYYLLADSPEGLRKEAEVSGRAFADKPTHGNVRQGFVYERVPHITLKSIANNAEIDVIYDEHQPKVQAALERLNAALRGHKTPFRVTTGGREGKDVRFDAPADATFTMPSGEVVSASALVEWEVPREAPADWPEAAKKPLADFWEARIARQKAIDASIAAKAEFEFLYDRPYVDPKTVRVAGPFTVESLSPHRTLGVDENDELIDPLQVKESGPPYGQTFEQMILDNLRAAGVQQAHKADRITFTSLTPWPGEMVCAEGRFREGDAEKRAAIFIGPEFGTVSRPDLVQAAREAGDAGFDVLIACAFNYEAHASEFSKLGRIPVLKARMNADLHMGGELKATGKGNLFVVFGEPDIEILHEGDGTLMRARERRGRVRSDHRRGQERRRRRHRLLVHRHRLQRRELLRPPRLLPRPERPLRRAEDDAEGGDQRGRLGHAEQRGLATVPDAEERPDRREGHQPPRRRGDEGVPGGVNGAATISPGVVVLGGPNGAGKSTAAPRLLRGSLKVEEFVNADTLAQGLSVFRPAGRGHGRRPNYAGATGRPRISAKEFRVRSDAGEPGARPSPGRLKERGYLVHIVYLWLPDVELALARVAERVRAGGHDVPADAVAVDSIAAASTSSRSIGRWQTPGDSTMPADHRPAARRDGRRGAADAGSQARNLGDGGEGIRIMSNPEPTLKELFEDGRSIDEALKEAARDARRLHKALGNPMATWKRRPGRLDPARRYRCRHAG